MPAAHLRAATWNIHSARGLDGQTDPMRIVREALKVGPDILCLQEVWRRSRRGDVPTLLGEAGYHVAFGAALRTWPRGEYGLLIASRLPILTSRELLLENAAERHSRRVMRERRIALLAKLDSGLETHTVVNTHWSLDPEDRLASAHRMVSELQGEWRPTMVAGDLNACADEESVARLCQGLDLSDAEAEENRPTFPAERPTSRIDFLLAGAGWRVNTVDVSVSEASDHRLVVGELLRAAQGNAAPPAE